MSGSNLCGSCQYWINMQHEMNRPFGICEHPLVDSKIVTEKNESPYADKAVFTDATFGCIYHTPGHGNVVASLSDKLPCENCEHLNPLNNKICDLCGDKL